VSAHEGSVRPSRLSKAWWVGAVAWLVSFVGVRLVDPILPALARELKASPRHLERFTYLSVVTAVTMLVSWVIGAVATVKTRTFRARWCPVAVAP
jgi:MFS transporter, ACDE family, multidrug resistance protein